jgi:hypothetical protein
MHVIYTQAMLKLCPLLPWCGTFPLVAGGDDLQKWMIAVNILNKQLKLKKGGPAAWVLGGG